MGAKGASFGEQANFSGRFDPAYLGELELGCCPPEDPGVGLRPSRSNPSIGPRSVEAPCHEFPPPTCPPAGLHMSSTPWRRSTVTLEVDAAVEHSESASVPGGAPSAGSGKFWVRSDSPNVPVFTSDDGMDVLLNALPGGPAFLDSLQFYVDSSDRNVYPGTGTVVRELLDHTTGTGTLSGVSYLDGAWDFPGSNNNIEIPKSSDADDIFDSGGTAFVLVYIDSDGEGNLGRILDTSGTGGAGWVLFTHSESGGSVDIGFLRVWSSAIGDWQTDTTEVPLGQWVTLAVTYDGSSTTNDPVFYLNGETLTFTEENTPTGSLVSDAGNPVRLGDGLGDTRAYDGRLRILKLWDRVLTQDEIQDVHNQYAAEVRDLPFRSEQVLIAGAATGVADSTADDLVIGNNTADVGMTFGGQSSGQVRIGFSNNTNPLHNAIRVALNTGTFAFRCANNDRWNMNGSLFAPTVAGFGDLGSSTFPVGEVHVQDNVLIGGAVPADGLTEADLLVLGNGTTSTGMTLFMGSGNTANIVAAEVSGTLRGRLRYAGAAEAWFFAAGGSDRMIMSQTSLYPTDGNLSLGLTASNGWNSLVLTERADHVGTPTATRGEVWLRDDSPNVLVFTDDAGTDHVLNASSGGATGGEAGVFYTDCQFYIDPNDPTSYDGATTPTEITDLRGSFASAGAVSNVTITDGYFNFNGTTSEIDMGTLPTELEDLFDGGGSFEAWIRAESEGVDSSSARIADTTDSTTEGWVLFVDNETTGNVELNFWQYLTGGNNSWATTSTVVPLDQWIHVVVIYDGSSATNDPTFYIDGVEYSIALGNLTQTASTSGSIDSDAGNSLFIGNRSDQARTWDGDIGLVRMWDRQLSATEVQALRRLGFSRFDPNILGVDSSATTKDITVQPGASSSNNGGSLNLIGGDGNGNGGNVVLSAGATTGTGSDGDIQLLAPGGGDILASFVLDASAASTTLLGSDGDSSGDDGISLALTAGDGTGPSNADGGAIDIAAGALAGSGANGRVNLTTQGIDASVAIRTTSGFTGTRHEHFTYGNQVTLSPGTFFQNHIIVGTVDTNGRHMKIDLWATAQDNSNDAGMDSFRLIQTYYRASGNTSALSAHLSDTQGNGQFGSDWSFSLGTDASGNIYLQVSNFSGSVTYTANVAVYWSIQEGGFTS